MKLKISILLLAFSLIIGACSNKENVAKDEETKIAEETKPNDEQLLYDIRLDEQIKLIAPDGKIEVLPDDGLPSEPVKSPKGNKAVYISGTDFEVLGDLYLVDLKEGYYKVLIPAEGTDVVKKVIWEDDEHVLVIIGYSHGTVSIGGDIFRVNINTKERELVKSFDSKIQVTDIELNDGILYYSGIKYIDDTSNESVDYKGEVELN